MNTMYFLSIISMQGGCALRHRPALSWTVEHTVYPPLEAERNSETILVRCLEEYADCSVCHRVFYDRENIVSYKQSWKSACANA